jgi:hypothetical protein
LTQVARIEEQVKKLATGLRQLVDYLAVPDPRALQQSASAAPSPGGPSSKEPVREGAAPRAAKTNIAAAAPPELAIVDAKSIVDDVLALTAALAQASHVEVVADGDGLAGARVERWHALGTLGTLVSHAIRHCSMHEANGQGAPARLHIGGGVASQGVVFELVVPGLSMLEGWQLEHFQTRPAPTEGSEFYRTMSICAAVVRGHGGKLLIESADGPAIVVRFSCVNEAPRG